MLLININYKLRFIYKFLLILLILIYIVINNVNFSETNSSHFDYYIITFHVIKMNIQRLGGCLQN